MNLSDGLSDPLFVALLSVVGILVLGSIGAAVLKRKSPGPGADEVARRVRTWWMLAGVFCISLAIGRMASLAVLAFTSFLALKEYLTAIPTRRADRRVLFWAYLSIPLQYWWVHMEWYLMFIIFIPVWVALALQIRMVLIGETTGFLTAIGTIQWGLFTTVYNLSHTAYLLVLHRSDQDGVPIGPALVFFLVVLTQANDVAQFLWGKSIGGPKVVPKVSPGKTWAGLVGGVLTTSSLGAGLWSWLDPIARSPWIFGAVAGATIGVAGFFGDLTVSLMKRDLGLKDSGDLLPGHGGILDRVDSLTYTAPIFFHLLFWWYF